MKKLFLPIGALALYSSAGAQQQADRPNVLLIYADDIGYGDLSCNGTSAVRTPNVEKLASEGIRFTNAHCAAATSLLRAMPCLRENMPGGEREPELQPAMLPCHYSRPLYHGRHV